jgi:hypothetical protein
MPNEEQAMFLSETTLQLTSESDNSRSLTSIDIDDQCRTTSFVDCQASKLREQTKNHEHELDAPYRRKPFYGKEWLLQQVHDHMQQPLQPAPTVLTVVGSSGKFFHCAPVNLKAFKDVSRQGSGKTHLCCELKWPTRTDSCSESGIICASFLSYYLNKRCLADFYSYLKSSIYATVLSETGICPRDTDGDDLANSEPTSLADAFIRTVLKPVSQLALTRNYHVLIDGIDESLFQSSMVKSKSANRPFDSSPSPVQSNLTDEIYSKAQNKNILVFLNSVFQSFPPWLNLILVCNRLSERKLFKTYPNLAQLANKRICVDVGAMASISVATSKKRDT